MFGGPADLAATRPSCTIMGVRVVSGEGDGGGAGRREVSMMLIRWVAVAATVAVAAGMDGDGSDKLAAARWIGKKVIARRETPLAEPTRPDDGAVTRVYTVEKVEGGRLRVTGDGLSGWLEPGEVVPFEKAYDFFSDEILAEPDEPGPRHRRGVVLTLKGDFAGAIADFDEALRLSPRAVGTLLCRGGARLAARRLDEAAADVNEALRLDPRSWRAWPSAPASAWPAATSTAPWPTATPRSPSSPGEAVVLAARGDLLASKGRLDPAIVDFSRAIKLRPDLVAPRASAPGPGGRRSGRSGPSRTSPRPWPSRPTPPPCTTTAAWPGTTRASTPAPSRTSPRPCGSTPATGPPTTTAPWPATP